MSVTSCSKYQSPDDRYTVAVVKVSAVLALVQVQLPLLKVLVLDLLLVKA